MIELKEPLYNKKGIQYKDCATKLEYVICLVATAILIVLIGVFFGRLSLVQNYKVGYIATSVLWCVLFIVFFIRSIILIKYPIRVIVDSDGILIKNRFSFIRIYKREFGIIEYNVKKNITSTARALGDENITIAYSRIFYTYNGKKYSRFVIKSAKLAYVLLHIANDITSGTNFGLAYDGLSKKQKNIES